jgi:hypothetical protein
MLSDRHAAVLPEWLREAARQQRLVPPELLPALLDRAKQSGELREAVLAVGGERARWLAGHNPEWSFAARLSPELWETGTTVQRRSLFCDLRGSEPAAAREKLEAVWKTEPTENRATLLATLQLNLSEADAPFADAALDDRSRQVRLAAVDLLARLPASAFAARMTQRAAPLLQFKPGGLLSRPSLEVTLPPEPDAAAIRDGLDLTIPHVKKVLGERAIVLVLILSAVPLREWTARSGQTPAALLKAAEKSEFGRALATGWSWAALRQGDAAWAAALLDSSLQPHPEYMPNTPLLQVLPEAERAARLTAALRAGAWQSADVAAWSAFAQQLQHVGPWPPAFAREILSVLRRQAGGLAPYLRPAAQALLLRVPPELLGEAAAGWPTDQEEVLPLVDLLTFRHEALTALATP